ncbi:MAG: Rha family transcriptional regulator [Culicoidibacterales bacterium]
MENLVKTNEKGQNVTTSLMVAKTFGKMHKNVIQDIQNLSCTEDFNRLNFQPISYTDSMNREQRAYEMTIDGFSFLVMGYTGTKAGEFKETYILEFNKREEMLKSDDYILFRAAEIQKKKISELENKLNLNQQVIEIQAVQIKELAPKAEYTETVLQSSETYVTTRIAQELGISAMVLNKKLHEMRVQRKVDGQWILYTKFLDKGYAKSHTVPFTKKDGTTGTNTQTVWTEKGRFMIHKLFKNQQSA